MAKISALDSVVNVRVTRAEKDELREAAAVAGLTLSAYCRHRMLGRAVVANTDLAVIRELRRLGGLLKRVHVESEGAYSEATATALRTLHGAIGKLANDRQEGREP